MNNLIFKFNKYLILIIFLFISINVLISLSWYVYLKLNKIENAYNATQLKLLDLNQVEGNSLFEETWIERKYIYDQYTEYKEKHNQYKKYVNISKLDGHKINNNFNCKKNFSFYGSSITFGYNVTDEQTFSQKFQKILNSNSIDGCIFNFGRAGYGSTQENILFVKHILENRYSEGDYVFIDGAAERGLKKGINTDYLTYAQNLGTIPRYKKYLSGFVYFWNSLPIIQLSLRLKEKFLPKENNELSNLKETTLREIVDVYKKNIEIRNSICKKFLINCFTFIHPQSGLHGKYFGQFFKSNYPQSGIYNFEDKKNLETFKKKERKIQQINQGKYYIRFKFSFC